MRRETNWKKAVKYVLGIAGLAASVAAALLFPQWYCAWQDRQIMETVTLSSRENIEFLDTKSLDIAGRMKILSEAETMDWMEYQETPFVSEQEAYEFLDHSREVVKKWGECGLLPERCMDWVTDSSGEFGSSLYIYADNAAFQVFLLRFYGPDGELLTFVIDAELDMIYYASCSSGMEMERIARNMGYGSFDEISEMLSKGIFPDGSNEDYSQMDFASACGAQEAVVTDDFFYPELTLELQYDNFTANAYRGLVETDAGVGYTTIIGTRQWRSLVEEVASMCGYLEGQIEMAAIHAEYEAIADINESMDHVMDMAISEEKMIKIE